MLIVTILLAMATGSVCMAQTHNLTGSWQGALSIQAMKLRIVFNLNAVKEGGWRATLDSPDQGATGIKVDTVIVTGDSVHLVLAALMGRYDGLVLPGDSLMSGSWQQAGMTFPLELKKSDAPLVLRRPQEPKPPFPYEREEISIENSEARLTLAGTLTKPKGAGPFAAAILITGSGPQDRDEALLGHKPFLVLSDYLTRQGIAVLRCDDRGVGKSTGKFAGSTTLDFVSDTKAAVRFLAKQPDIRHDRIGLIGHSEGGLIAPIVASESKDVAFIVLMAGPSLMGKEILLMQDSLISLANGATPDEIRQSLVTNSAAFEISRTEKDTAKAVKRIEDLVYTASKSNKRTGVTDEALRRLAWITATQITSPWMQFFLFHDPMPTLRKVKCPVLAINGEKDLQVPAVANLNGIERAMKEGGNADATVKMLQGLNHLFQVATTGSPTEYSTIEETMSPLALQTIGDWILAHVK
jgi:hypothetical protein